MTWIIAGVATALVMLRPFGWPEAVWAVTGAVLVVALGLLPLKEAWSGVLKGADVYLFLVGMMLLSEVSRQEGLFDWLASVATEFAKGSSARLFALIYAIGTIVTIFLSNDATAVVLTPAVYAATRVARVADPMPYLLICAFIANAASFVLPISNPANLVVFSGGAMPPLEDWLRTFLLPSVVAITVTYAALWTTQRQAIARDSVASDIVHPHLMLSGRIAAAGIAVTAVVLLWASAHGLDLGAPTFFCGALTVILVVAVGRARVVDLLNNISWSILPLVAGLFVLVEALTWTGVVGHIAEVLHQGVQTSANQTNASAGLIVAVASNLINNLPAGLIAASAIEHVAAPRDLAASILIGVDLGPNLSVTGSLATILWLTALRREGIEFGAWRFFKIGAVVMPPTLLLALGTLLLSP